MIQHEKALTILENQLLEEARTGGGSPSQQAARIRRIMKLQSQIFRAQGTLKDIDGSVIQVIATDPVRLAFDALVKRHDNVFRVIMTLAETSWKDSEAERKANADVGASLEALANERRTFLEACRRDIGPR